MKLLLALCLALARPPLAAAAVPTLAQLAPRALPERRLQSLPQVQNFVGAVGLRHDLVSLGTMALSPFNGNFLNSTLSVDGAPAVLASSRYGACEGTRAGTAGVVAIENAVRLPFEQPAVLQRWLLSPGDALPHVLAANLDGPFFRACDLAPGQGTCGWGTSFPVDRATSFTSSIDAADGTMLTVDGKTGVAVASRVWFEGGAGSVSVTVDASNATFMMEGSFTDASGERGVALLQAMGVGVDAAAALAALAPLLGDGGFAAAFSDACELFEARWQSAFQVPQKDGGPGAHFGGNLPVLSSSRPEIDRLFYWAALAFVSLERTNLRSGPRQFVISQGPSNSLDGSAGMGGSGQFTWDLSFAATAMSLLEPDAVRDQAAYIMNSTSGLGGPPPAQVPQCWDAFPDFSTKTGLGLGSYRFDYYSAFLLVMSHVALNNATAWLRAPLSPSLGNISGVDFLLAMARSREGYPASPASPLLTDYGDNKRDYLEVVSTYTSTVPALQYGSVGMALAAARLLEQTGLNASAPIAALARALRANASAIADAALAQLWRDEDGGAWRCVYANGSSTAVRTVTDYVYVAQALGFLGRSDAPQLPPNVAAASVKFFGEELLAPGDAWVRALSLGDPLCADVMDANASIETLMTCRADWGCFAEYISTTHISARHPLRP